jgi:putative membrane protein
MKNEWITILKERKISAAIIVILFVPTLYSGTYLWANWDPYSHLERLPVAVVNEDVKTNYNGTTYAIGNDLVKELKKNKSFKWQFVNKKKAENGIKNNQYYFEIYIPQNFSRHATTLTSQKPKPLILYYKVNVGSNFIASQIGTTGIDKIRTKLSQQLSENYAKVIFGRINWVGKDLAEAAGGSKQLTSGINQLSIGTQDIVNGMEKQVGPLDQLSSGANKLSQEAARLSKGADQIQGRLTQVNNNFSSLENGLSALNSNSGQLASGLTPLSSRSKQLNQAIVGYQKSHPNLGNDTQFQKIIDMSQNLSGGLDTFNSSFTSFNQGVNQNVQTIRSSLGTGPQTISLNLKGLTNGARQFADSQAEISKGTTNVNNGWKSVINHLKSIQKGENDLASGSGNLTDKLAKGAKQVQAIHSGQPIYEMMSNPVRLKEQLENSVPNYGTGLAPYFISLSLYVGALLLTTVFPLGATSKRPPSSMDWFLSKFIMLAFISFWQSVITNLFLIHVVGLDPVNHVKQYLFTFFTSLIFMSLILFLVVTLGDIGRFLAIILLVLQLTSSGGTFPIQLAPQFLQSLHSLLPMSYTVQGFRSIISTGDNQLLRTDVIALTTYLIISVFLTIVVLKIKHKKWSDIKEV